MAQTAKLFTVDGNQALNLPRGLEFDAREVLSLKTQHLTM